MPSYVIVGASRGIGYQFLKTLSQDPSNTIIGLARNVAETESKVSADNLANVHIIHGDLTDAASLKKAAEATSKITKGSVDYLIINGAYMSAELAFNSPADFHGQEETFLDELNLSILTNTVGLLYSISAFLSLVRESIIKKIVYISTGHADINCAEVGELSNAVSYAMSKAAANMLVTKYALQLKSEGIPVYAISPGVVLTQAGTLAEAPQPIQDMYASFVEPFRKFEPTYNGPIHPRESVAAMLKTVDRLTIKDTGAFLSHHGNKRWAEGA